MTKNKPINWPKQTNEPLKNLNKMNALLTKQTTQPDKPILGYLEIAGVIHPVTDEKDWAIIKGENDQKKTHGGEDDKRN